MFLSVVGGQHGDLLGRISEQPHVHEQSHHVLSLAQVLDLKTLQDIRKRSKYDFTLRVLFNELRRIKDEIGTT